MIEIIKRGKIPQEKKYEATCYTCKTVFTALQEDGKVVNDQRDGDFVTFHCPVCNRECHCDLKLGV